MGDNNGESGSGNREKEGAIGVGIRLNGESEIGTQREGNWYEDKFELGVKKWE